MTTRLLILIILAERPLHGYGVLNALKQARVELWTDVKVGSVYHALQKLTDEGCLRARQGAGASKAEYALTRKGRAEITRLIQRALARPHVPFAASFNIVISAWALLSHDERAEVIAQARARVRQALASWDEGARTKGAESDAPAHVRLAFEAGRAHVRLDAELIEQLAAIERS